MNPLVSICCITYNHVKYITQAIEGFLMQETDFAIEILINDDASTDGTTEIIKEYQQKYPELIKPVFHGENEYSKGLRGISMRNLFPIAKGKYIAFCEGDDYWTDSMKLKKQVELLESDQSVIYCGSNVDIVDSNNTVMMSGENNSGFKTGYINFLEVLDLYRFYTGTILFRNPLMPHGKLYEYPEKFKEVAPGDWFITILCGYYFGTEKLYYNFSEKFGCYRKHNQGIWTPVALWKKQLMFIEFYKQFNKLSKGKYQSIISKKIAYFYFQAFKGLVIHKKYLISFSALYNSILWNPLTFSKAVLETVGNKSIKKIA